jgi:hypothetical protein
MLSARFTVARPCADHRTRQASPGHCNTRCPGLCRLLLQEPVGRLQWPVRGPSLTPSRVTGREPSVRTRVSGLDDAAPDPALGTLGVCSRNTIRFRHKLLETPTVVLCLQLVIDFCQRVCRWVMSSSRLADAVPTRSVPRHRMNKRKRCVSCVGLSKDVSGDAKRRTMASLPASAESTMRGSTALMRRTAFRASQRSARNCAHAPASAEVRQLRLPAHP